MGNIIIRSTRPEEPFLILPQKMVRDANLSYRARGLLARLLSNISGYRMNATDLAKEGREGRDSIRSAIAELKQAGYIISKLVRDKDGNIRTETYVFDEPQAPDVDVEKKAADFIATKNAKKSPSTAKEGSGNEPTGKMFGNFKCEFDREKRQFFIGAALMEQLKSNFPMVDVKTPGGIGLFIQQCAITLASSNGRNQVDKGNWTPRQWLNWKLGERQKYLGDVELVGKYKADQIFKRGSTNLNRKMY